MPRSTPGDFARPRLTFRTLPFEVTGARVWRSFFSDATTPALWLDSSASGATGGTAGRGPVSILCDASGPGAHYLTFTIGTDGQPGPGGDLFSHLSARLQSASAGAPLTVPEDWPCDFALGWVGAFGYELRHLVEPGGDTPSAHAGLPRPVEAPDAALVFATRAIVIEHGVGTHLMALVDDADPAARTVQNDWLKNTAATLRALADGLPSRSKATGIPECPEVVPLPAPFRFAQSKQRYLENIGRCLDYIAAGDSYEICLTNTASGPSIRETFAAADAPYLAAFERLRQVSPVPYGVFARFPRTEGATASPEAPENLPVYLLGASPERFLKVDQHGNVSAKPIKGTRPRGTNDRADAAIRGELRTNPKDRAENLMIVDLLRNDLSRVCEPGSVRVPLIFDVETYSHVHQLVSSIEGQLTPGRTPVDLLAASFPGGSMTGAPKVRTMEIIAELEGMARGFYSGAVGWISPTGAADLSITIRTVVDDGRRASFGVGGAIVSDSDPEAEYEETLVKASALLEALGASIVHDDCRAPALDSRV